jgi:hypothetical protein
MHAAGAAAVWLGLLLVRHGWTPEPVPHTSPAAGDNGTDPGRSSSDADEAAGGLGSFFGMHLISAFAYVLLPETVCDVQTVVLLVLFLRIIVSSGAWAVGGYLILFLWRSVELCLGLWMTRWASGFWHDGLVIDGIALTHSRLWYAWLIYWAIPVMRWAFYGNGSGYVFVIYTLSHVLETAAICLGCVLIVVQFLITKLEQCLWQPLHWLACRSLQAGDELTWWDEEYDEVEEGQFVQRNQDGTYRISYQYVDSNENENCEELVDVPRESINLHIGVCGCMSAVLQRLLPHCMASGRIIVWLGQILNSRVAWFIGSEVAIKLTWCTYSVVVSAATFFQPEWLGVWFGNVSSDQETPVTSNGDDGIEMEDTVMAGGSTAEVKTLGTYVSDWPEVYETAASAFAWCYGFLVLGCVLLASCGLAYIVVLLGSVPERESEDNSRLKREADRRRRLEQEEQERRREKRLQKERAQAKLVEQEEREKRERQQKIDAERRQQEQACAANKQRQEQQAREAKQRKQARTLCRL